MNTVVKWLDGRCVTILRRYVHAWNLSCGIERF